MTAELVVLRFVHVLGAIFWVGSAFFSVLYLMPALMAAGPAAGQVMATLQQRKLFTVLPVVALLTILSGVRLLMITSNNFSADYFRSTGGMTFGIGGLAGILAFVLGMTLVRPAGARAGQLAQTLRTITDDAERARVGAEVQRLQQRSAAMNKVVLAMLFVAAAAMAVARYLS